MKLRTRWLRSSWFRSARARWAPSPVRRLARLRAVRITIGVGVLLVVAGGQDPPASVAASQAASEPVADLRPRAESASVDAEVIVQLRIATAPPLEVGDRVALWDPAGHASAPVASDVVVIDASLPTHLVIGARQRQIRALIDAAATPLVVVKSG